MYIHEPFKSSSSSQPPSDTPIEDKELIAAAQKQMNAPHKTTLGDATKMGPETAGILYVLVAAGANAIRDTWSRSNFSSYLSLASLRNVFSGPSEKQVVSKIFAKAIKAESDAKAKENYAGIKSEIVTNAKLHNTSIKAEFLDYLKLNMESDTGGYYDTRLLSTLHKTRDIMDKNMRTFVDDVTSEFATVSSQKLKESIPVSNSMQERDSKRMPTDVLIDLLSFLGNLEAPKGDLINDVKHRLMTHDLSLASTHQFLEKVIQDNPGTHIDQKCRVLKEQLAKSAEPTQLLDNVYGRALDTHVVAQLVNNPPPEVTKAVSAMGHGWADYLDDLNLSPEEHENFSKSIKDLLQEKNPRFWFPKVPELRSIATSEGDVVKELINYLRSEKQTGIESISVLYLLAKTSVILKNDVGISPDWLLKADGAYTDLSRYNKDMRVRIDDEVRNSDVEVEKLNSEGAGITLHYQPSAAKESWMEPSERPSTVFKPAFDQTDKKAPESAKRAQKAELEMGVPWAIGISGTTNILLHAWEHFNTDNQPIDKKAAFLAAIMFVVYDGGHSINEPLWAANEIQKNRNIDLGFDLKSTVGDKEFIPDYEKFVNLFEGELKGSVSNAFDSAFQKTTEYFRENSYYAKKEQI